MMEVAGKVDETSVDSRDLRCGEVPWLVMHVIIIVENHLLAEGLTRRIIGY